LNRILWISAVVFACALPAVAATFDLTDVEGGRHRLADYRGRWVVLNFWATWCVPCIQEIPEIAAYHRDHREVVVIGVAIDAEDLAKTKQFARKLGHDYPLVISDDGVEKQLGSLKALPTTRIYDPRGKLVYDKPGRVDRKSLEGMIPDTTFSAPSAQRSFHARRTRLG